MRLTPRSDEVATIAAVLNEPHATAEDAAKACIKAVGELLTMRDWYAAAHRWGDDQPSAINVGPFASEADAKALMTKLAIGGTATIVKLSSSGQLVAQIDGRKNAKDYCMDANCGHAGWSHLAEGSGRGQCALTGCRCRGWKK